MKMKLQKLRIPSMKAQPCKKIIECVMGESSVYKPKCGNSEYEAMNAAEDIIQIVLDNFWLIQEYRRTTTISPRFTNKNVMKSIEVTN